MSVKDTRLPQEPGTFWFSHLPNPTTCSSTLYGIIVLQDSHIIVPRIVYATSNQ